MNTLTVPSSFIIPNSTGQLTPAMTTVIWVMGHELDRLRISPNAQDAVWLEIPSKKLRGEGARDDNQHLVRVLDQLMTMKITGEYRNDPWGAVLIGEYQITQGGVLTRLLVPPAAVRACLSPKTFAKIEEYAVYSFSDYARRLYGDLSDKKRLGNPWWEYELPALWRVYGVEEKKSYHRYDNLRTKIILPSVKEINDFGTVKLKFSSRKTGRSVSHVRFDWEWKSLDQARETEEENNQPKKARHMDRAKNDAPPLTGYQIPDGETADTEKAARNRRRDMAYAKFRKEYPDKSYGEFLDWWKPQAHLSVIDVVEGGGE